MDEVKPPKHKYWRAGEPDCPKDIRAGNGELHTLQCKVCGEKSPPDEFCWNARPTPSAGPQYGRKHTDGSRSGGQPVGVNEPSEGLVEEMPDGPAEYPEWLSSLQNILDGVEDEGDRVYFGSTNDADDLREVVIALKQASIPLRYFQRPDLHRKIKELSAALSQQDAMREALEPVIHWYQSDEHPERSLADIVADVVADLQADRAFILNPPKHRFWGAGESDCPPELKAGNGELHTLRCKVCGQDSPRDKICRQALSRTGD